MKGGKEQLVKSMKDMQTKGCDNDLHYNFVFLFARYDFAQSLLGSELYDHPQVRVHKHAFESNELLQKLFHLHTAYSVNDKVNLPLKSLWFKRMYDQGFDNDLPTCFVYLGGNMVRYDGGFCDYVRRRDSRNRVVMIHWDLISKKIAYDYSTIRNKVDLAIIHDEEEAKRYGIHYFQETTYSKMVEVPKDAQIKQDVYFLGAAKDRLAKIYEVYEYLQTNGVSCKFQIAGVSEEDQINREGLEYITYVPYEQYHGGIEHYIYPSPRLQKRCRVMAETGADFVTCQHSHIIGTREKCYGSEILYGQGNTIFGHEGDSKWDQGLICIIDLVKDEVSVQHKVRYVPIIAAPDGEWLAQSNEARGVLESMEEASIHLKDSESIRAQWEDFCAEQAPEYLPMLFGWRVNLIRANKVLRGKLVSLFVGWKQRRNAMNLVRCDAHREVVETILESDFYCDRFARTTSRD